MLNLMDKKILTILCSKILLILSYTLCLVYTPGTKYIGAFSVTMFACKLFFSVKDFSATTLVRILKFGTKLDSDELYCVAKKQPYIAYQSLYLFIFLSLQWKLLSQISQERVF